MADTKIASLTHGTAASTDRIPTAVSPYGSGNNAYLDLADINTYLAGTTQTLTNKTFDTAGSGNSLSINGVAATANTGTGSVVRGTSPTLVTPTLGVASATSINKVALTAPATGSTITVADGKTLTSSNTLTLTATDGSTLAIGAGGTLGTAAYVNTGTSGSTVPLLNAANTFSATQTLAGGTLNGTLLNMSQTWGSTGTYTGLKYNVTDSGPANAASLLVDLQVGGTSKFSVNKSGVVTVPQGGTASAPTIVNASQTNTGMYFPAAAQIAFTSNGTLKGDFSVTVGGFWTFAGKVYSPNFGTTAASGTIDLNADVILSRAAAATLQHGAADAASPVAQSQQVQSVAAGTSNTAGTNWTFNASKGTGTGNGGSILFKTAPAGSSGSSQNSLITALTLAASSALVNIGVGTTAYAQMNWGTTSVAPSSPNNGDMWFDGTDLKIRVGGSTKTVTLI